LYQCMQGHQGNVSKKENKSLQWIVVPCLGEPPVPWTGGGEERGGVNEFKKASLWNTFLGNIYSLLCFVFWRGEHGQTVHWQCRIQ